MYNGNLIDTEYRAWDTMIRRCYNPTTESYRTHGARGIKVCDRWRQDFRNFFADMGLKPSPKHELDRKDNDGNYEPGNCQWATHSQQMRNRRTSRVLTVMGVSRTLAEWTELLGVSSSTIRERLRRGWSQEKAVSTPAG